MPTGETRGRRAGPTKDPNSARSESAGIKYVHLPAEGYKGRVPKWPIAEASKREATVWRETWRTPQAHIWADEKLWRLRTIALYVRWSVRAEAPDCPSGVFTQVNRLADQLGLTPSGMLQNGWKVVADELAPRRSEPATLTPPAAPAQARRPLTGLTGGA